MTTPPPSPPSVVVAGSLATPARRPLSGDAKPGVRKTQTITPPSPASPTQDHRSPHSPGHDGGDDKPEDRFPRCRQTDDGEKRLVGGLGGKNLSNCRGTQEEPPGLRGTRLDGGIGHAFTGN